MKQDINIYLLNHGSSTADVNIFEANTNLATPMNPNPQGKLITNCFFSILLEHPQEGRILIDTGLPPKEQFPKWVFSMMSIDFDEKYSMENQLEKLKLKPKDINKIILTHMHMDHNGGIDLFKDHAMVYVNRKEAEYAFMTVMSTTDIGAHGFYFRNQVLAPVKNMIYLDDDIELFDGIHLIMLPGHTPGTMGVLIETTNGNFIFPSDTCSLNSNYHGIPSGLIMDQLAANASIAKLKYLEKKYKAEIVFAHDMERFMQINHAPNKIN